VPYVVPICYVYDGGCVYGHAVDGMKRHAMQTNPQVCFEVEPVDDFDHLAQLRMAAESAEFVVASGSLPPGVSADYYQGVADICRQLGVRLILDTSGGGLQHVSSGVFVLKASVRELRECVGRPLATESEQLAAAHELIESRCASSVGVTGISRCAARDTACKPAVFGNSDAGWERRWGGRRDGCRDRGGAQSRVAACQIRSARNSGGGSHADDTWYGSL
jgi:pfkB family carbohydrate kinase